MNDTNIIEIVTPLGDVDRVNLITYLLSDDEKKQYVVYSKDNNSIAGDKVIYVSRLHNNDNILSITEIVDDAEWLEVQKLLRKIANAKD